MEDATEHPQMRRLKVSGYMGAGGRVYTMDGPIIKITGLRSELTTGESRDLISELREFIRIVEGGQVNA